MSSIFARYYGGDNPDLPTTRNRILRMLIAKKQDIIVGYDFRDIEELVEQTYLEVSLYCTQKMQSSDIPYVVYEDDNKEFHSIRILGKICYQYEKETFEEMLVRIPKQIAKLSIRIRDQTIKTKYKNYSLYVKDPLVDPSYTDDIYHVDLGSSASKKLTDKQAAWKLRNEDRLWDLIPLDSKGKPNMLLMSSRDLNRWKDLSSKLAIGVPNRGQWIEHVDCREERGREKQTGYKTSIIKPAGKESKPKVQGSAFERAFESNIKKTAPTLASPGNEGHSK